jgi:hypothetical protein
MEEITEQEISDFMAEIAASGMTFAAFIDSEILAPRIRQNSSRKAPFP